MAGSDPGHFAFGTTPGRASAVGRRARKSCDQSAIVIVAIVDALFTTFGKWLFTKGFERSAGAAGGACLLLGRIAD
jgi:hypothetical protein